LSDSTKIANHTQYVEKLLEMVKRVNDIEGQKGGKRLKVGLKGKKKKNYSNK
jgi:hypothetical protein